MGRQSRSMTPFEGEWRDPAGQGWSAVGGVVTSLPSNRRSPSGLRPASGSDAVPGARIRAWRRSSRPSRCHRHRPPNPCKASRQPPSTAGSFALPQPLGWRVARVSVGGHCRGAGSTGHATYFPGLPRHSINANRRCPTPTGNREPRRRTRLLCEAPTTSSRTPAGRYSTRD